MASTAAVQVNIERLYNQGVSEVSMMFGILDQYEKKPSVRLLMSFGETRKNIKWWNNFPTVY